MVMKNCFASTGVLLFLAAATLALTGCKGEQDKQASPAGGPATKAPDSPEAPPDAGPKTPIAGKKLRLADLKFDLPKGWEAEHRDGSNTWKVSKDAPPDYPDVYVG